MADAKTKTKKPAAKKPAAKKPAAKKAPAKNTKPKSSLTKTDEAVLKALSKFVGNFRGADAFYSVIRKTNPKVKVADIQKSLKKFSDRNLIVSHKGQGKLWKLA